ncbi:Hypothetical protein R9X50_00455900 [Acrodontium crateriforme]|uniref:F-box domain-containing protein n=1 Tax=Acrodontium crateriforme TaxID=150365 RepID=A0AAQ3M4H8_9PEZI|nr:Hypothetical protein R9X50_00455900 [Acrodontium crateriforme]
MPSFQPLQLLPEELFQDILDRLSRDSLKSLSLASRSTYDAVLPLLWKEVSLVDCRNSHSLQNGIPDDHDDTPIIKKLLILATNPSVAECVQIVEHRCHLPPPAIFNELPRSTFSSQTLSTDPRTIRLTQAAVRSMRNVHTLRIIFGHPTLNDALLRCFFDKTRERVTPIRKLWLESCRIGAGCDLDIPHSPYGLPLQLDFSGVQSIRFRRLPLRPGKEPRRVPGGYEMVHARSQHAWEMQDAVGGTYTTSANTLIAEQTAMGPVDGSPPYAKQLLGSPASLLTIYKLPHKWDDDIYEELQVYTTSRENELIESFHIADHQERSMLAYRGPLLDPAALTMVDGLPLPPQLLAMQRERIPTSVAAMNMLNCASSSLTSLNLDWILTTPVALWCSKDAVSQQRWTSLFVNLFALRFPHLRAFQLRNAVVRDTVLPQGLYLLDHSRPKVRNNRADQADDDFTLNERQCQQIDLAGLEFMEAHLKLQCLAWPMEHFFSEHPPSADITCRVENVIDNLGRSLVDLRVDSIYRGAGEVQSENVMCSNLNSRERRRRFIERFASKMTILESLKIEGGMPRDERREIIRATHQCPLKKLVVIGVCYPLGNTWGLNGVDLTDALNRDEIDVLEAEDKDATWQFGLKTPEPVADDFKYRSEFGWPAGAPLLHHIATFHASTIRELKFCGYKGAPILGSETPITRPLLASLKHFHNLESIIMSFWLSTRFEQQARDREVINYWLDSRSPSSTALVRVTNEDEELYGWAKELRTKFAPNAIAWRVTSFLGPYLSPQAKQRPGGVSVRGSFCVGDWGGIFDIDVKIFQTAQALGAVCLSFTGPREELETERRKSKVDSRRWF